MYVCMYVCMYICIWIIKKEGSRVCMCVYVYFFSVDVSITKGKKCTHGKNSYTPSALRQHQYSCPAGHIRVDRLKRGSGCDLAWYYILLILGRYGLVGIDWD